MLTSRSNEQIKFLESLRKSKERKKHGLYLVEGEREILRAKSLESIFYAEESPVTKALGDKGVELIQVSSELLERISLRGEIMAIGKMKKMHLSQLSGEFFVALVGVEKPGNIGAILRTCDGCGVNGVLLVDPLVDHYHPNAIRASLGASFNLDIVTCTSKEAFEFIQEERLQLVTTSPDARENYMDANLEYPVIIALGQEDKGLPNEWMKGEKVYIPMEGICDSLNVSVAAGVVLYEVLRQNEYS